MWSTLGFASLRQHRRSCCSAAWVPYPRLRSCAAVVSALAIGLPLLAKPAEVGIAAGYPGDRGLGEDARVVLFEDFESGGVADLPARWDELRNPANLSLVPDSPAGGRSLRIAGTAGGGHLYTRLPAAQQRLYLRYYVKYGPASYHHAGAWVGGYKPPTAWPQGGAGERPAGNERFTFGFEPVGAELRWDSYAYWMGMRADGSGAFWGNTLLNDASLRVQPDRWTCVEILLEMNDPPETSGGVLAVWIDGVRVAHLGPGFPVGIWSGGAFRPDPAGEPFEGFRWRSDPALAINFVWLQLYTTSDPSGTVWFDQVVAASEYVGPIGAPDRSDADADGTPDELDNCPVEPNPEQADRDLDQIGDVCDLCPDYPSTVNRDVDGNGVGDACECGDQTGDGTVDVLDIIGINRAILGFVPVSPLCDTNEDGLCNVSDIVGANQKIFGKRAFCSRYPSRGP